MIVRNGNKTYYYQKRKYKTKGGEERECLCRTTHISSGKPKGKPQTVYTSKEIEEYRKALNKNNGNVSKTAKELNVPYSKIARLK